MRIVGATAGFIRLPLVLEGMIHGLAGGLAASLILYGAGFYVRKLTEPIPIIVMYAAKIAPLPVGGAIIGAGVLLGMVGSLMSLQRYLKL
jgi:cell division transport system permease protein